MSDAILQREPRPDGGRFFRSSVTSNFYGEGPSAGFATFYFFYPKTEDNGRTPSTETLEELIDSRYTALSWLRCLRSSLLPRLPPVYKENFDLDDGGEPNAVVWKFNFGQTCEPSATPQISLDE